MRKVLSIVPYPFLPYFSGGQKLIAQFNAHLGEACELHVVGTVNNDATLVEHYAFYPALKKSRLRFVDVTVFFRLKKLVQSNHIDTIIIEHPYLGWLGWMLKKATTARLIVHAHNIEYERFRTLGKSWWRILKWYETVILRAVDLAFCISEEDRQWMIEKLNIDREKCILVPYGINQKEAPSDKKKCKEFVCKEYDLNPQHALLLFNGLLNYKPNLDALMVIIKNINPILLESSFQYNILITGKHLPAELNDLKDWEQHNVRYAGFVDDIELHFKAADVFLNPVLSGGGVKTKMIEALGLNTSVVATETGALGVNKTICGNKLIIVHDGDWYEFAKAIRNTAIENNSIPSIFYQTYYWEYIVKRTIQRLEKL